MISDHSDLKDLSLPGNLTLAKAASRSAISTSISSPVMSRRRSFTTCKERRRAVPNCFTSWAELAAQTQPRSSSTFWLETSRQTGPIRQAAKDGWADQSADRSLPYNSGPSGADQTYRGTTTTFHQSTPLPTRRAAAVIRCQAPRHTVGTSSIEQWNKAMLAHFCEN